MDGVVLKPSAGFAWPRVIELIFAPITRDFLLPIKPSNKSSAICKVRKNQKKLAKA